MAAKDFIYHRCIGVMTVRMLFYKVTSENLTHFSILNEEYIKRDEYAEVEDIDVVLHSHLRTSKQNRMGLRTSHVPTLLELIILVLYA